MSLLNSLDLYSPIWCQYMYLSYCYKTFFFKYAILSLEYLDFSDHLGNQLTENKHQICHLTLGKTFFDSIALSIYLFIPNLGFNTLEE